MASDEASSLLMERMHGKRSGEVLISIRSAYIRHVYVRVSVYVCGKRRGEFALDGMYAWKTKRKIAD